MSICIYTFMTAQKITLSPSDQKTLGNIFILGKLFTFQTRLRKGARRYAIGKTDVYRVWLFWMSGAMFSFTRDI